MKLDGSGLFEISSQGMRDWFRDLFSNGPDTQKIGSYDPYDGVYVLVSNTKTVNLCTYSVNKTTFFIEGNAGTYDTFIITASQNWTVSLIDNGFGTGWATLSQIAGTGNKLIKVTLTSNINSV